MHDSDFNKQGLVYIKEAEAEKLKNVEVKENDVLLNITGDSICRTSIVPNEILPARVNQHVAILRANDRLHYKYLFHYLSLFSSKKILLTYNAGGTKNAITKAIIEEFCIPLPQMEEQILISEALIKIEQKLKYDNLVLNSILSLKSALMQVLLTGQVRIRKEA